MLGDRLVPGDLPVVTALSHHAEAAGAGRQRQLGDPGYDPRPLPARVDDPMRRPAVLVHRIALLGDELSLERQRIVWWAIAPRVETALWPAHHGDVPGGAGVLGEARVLADLPGVSGRAAS